LHGEVWEQYAYMNIEMWNSWLFSIVLTLVLFCFINISIVIGSYFQDISAFFFKYIFLIFNRTRSI